MDITAAIDVAIGLILMYLVLALFCSAINEFIASIFRLRSNSLASALTQLIDDKDLKNAFDTHGLIDTTKIATSGGNQGTTPAGGPQPKSWLSRQWNNSDPSYLSSRNVALALVGSLDKDHPVIDFQQVTHLIDQLPFGSNIKDVMDNAVLEAGDDLNKLRDSLANWFDGAMDRLSGAYKRNMQLISLAVGLVIAVFFNADTLHVGRELWQDRSMAQAIAQSAPEIMTKLCPNADCSNPTDANAPLPIAAVKARLNAAQTDLRGLPIGWNEQTQADFKANPGLGILGLLLTAIALAMGAPFWFDLLQKIMNFRNAGQPPPKAKTV